MQPWVRRGVLDRTTRRQPPKSEIRGPKPERRPNTEGRSHLRAFRISGFGLLSALGFRASGLGLCAHGLVVLSGCARSGAARARHCPETLHLCGIPAPGSPEFGGGTRLGTARLLLARGRGGLIFSPLRNM